MELKCNSCGSKLTLNHALLATCDYCGNKQLTDFVAKKNRKHSTSITEKPQITQPRFYSPDRPQVDRFSTLTEIAIAATAPTEVKVGRYSLALRNRDITDLDEIFDWYSNNELDELEELDVSGNKLTNIDKAFSLKSLKILRASNNKIVNINPKLIRSVHFIQVDVSNNLLTSCEGLANLKIDHLLLSNNKITTIPILNYSGYIDLSNNLIDSILGVQMIRGKYPLFKINTVVILKDNPIQDAERIKNLSINIVPISDYETLDTNGKDYFERVREDLTQSYSSQISLRGLFDYINDRRIYVCISDNKLLGVNSILGKELPEHLRTAGYENFEFIGITTNSKYNWNDFIQYFGLEPRKEKRGMGFGSIALIIGLIALLIYILS